MSVLHVQACDQTEQVHPAPHRKLVKPAHTVPLRNSSLYRRPNRVENLSNRSTSDEVTQLQVAFLEAQEERDSQQEKLSELQLNVSNLTKDLSTLRAEYQQLTDAKRRERENQTAVISSLQRKLTDKENEFVRVSEEVTELQQNLKQLNFRLQLYSEHTVDKTIIALQKRVSELDSALRQREWEIQIFETRLSSQSRQHKEELEEDVEKMLSMGSTIASLKCAVQEKDTKLATLTGETSKLQKLLSETQEKLTQLTRFAEDQTQQLKELRDQKNGLCEEMEQLKVAGEEVVAALQQQLQEANQAVQDREAHLERMVRELPDLPVTRAILDGYSRSHMLDSWMSSTSLPSPGGIYRKDSDPIMEGAVELKPLV